MGIFIDFIIILIISALTYLGYRKGLIKVAISFFAIIISILIALVLYKPIANCIMENTEIDENISSKIYSQIENVDFENIDKDQEKNNAVIEFAERYIDDAMKNATSNVAQYIADAITITIVELITLIVLIIIFRIVLLVLSLLSDIVSNWPFIKLFNKSGGTIYGILQGFLIIYIICAILYIANSVYGNGIIQKNIEKSYIGKTIYENNFIIDIVSK